MVRVNFQPYCYASERNGLIKEDVEYSGDVDVDAYYLSVYYRGLKSGICYMQKEKDRYWIFGIFSPEGKSNISGFDLYSPFMYFGRDVKGKTVSDCDERVTILMRSLYPWDMFDEVVGVDWFYRSLTADEVNYIHNKMPVRHDMVEGEFDKPIGEQSESNNDKISACYWKDGKQIPCADKPYIEDLYAAVGRIVKDGLDVE